MSKTIGAARTSRGRLVIGPSETCAPNYSRRTRSSLVVKNVQEHGRDLKLFPIPRIGQPNYPADTTRQGSREFPLSLAQGRLTKWTQCSGRSFGDLPCCRGSFRLPCSAEKDTNPRALSGIQLFAAGVVIAALAGELLPGLRLEGNLGWAVASFAVGVVMVLSLAAYGRRTDSSRVQSLRTAGAPLALVPVGFLATVAIDLLVDGMLVGLGTQLGSRQAIILIIALSLEIFFLCLSLVGELIERSLPSRVAVSICAGLCAVTAVGAVAAAAILGGAHARASRISVHLPAAPIAPSGFMTASFITRTIGVSTLPPEVSARKTLACRSWVGSPSLRHFAAVAGRCVGPFLRRLECTGS